MLVLIKLMCRLFNSGLFTDYYFQLVYVTQPFVFYKRTHPSLERAVSFKLTLRAEITDDYGLN